MRIRDVPDRFEELAHDLGKMMDGMTLEGRRQHNETGFAVLRGKLLGMAQATRTRLCSASPPPAQDQIARAYDLGFQDGLACFAWGRNDARVVGPGSSLLNDALKERTALWNYRPPSVATRRNRPRDTGPY